MPDPGVLIHSDDVDADVAPERVITFIDGIPGFPGSRRFVLLSISPDSDFQLLQSLDEPHVSMVVTVPWTFFPDYEPVIEETDREELELTSPDDAVLFCPVTLEAATRRAFLNLMGPFVVNAQTRNGRQLVLSGSDQPVRAAIELGS
jgi:flagellar assembly factor FliW